MFETSTETHPQGVTTATMPVNVRLLKVGVACLLLGMLVYVTARPEWALPLPNLNLSQYFPTLLHNLSGPLPSFFHVLGMSLVTVAILTPGKRGITTVCLGWGAINILFEIGQHRAAVGWLSSTLGEPDTWVLAQTLRYFHAGTFDPVDLLAILLAAIIALPLTRAFQSEATLNP